MRLVLAVDESAGSARAAAFVDRFLVGLPGVEISAVNVARGPVRGGPGGQGWLPPAGFGGVWGWPVPPAGPTIADQIDRERAAGRAVAADQAPPGSDVEVVFGDPAAAIQRAAEDLHADLIVVGANRRSWWRKLLGRSTPEDLVRHADRPVLVVR